MNSTIIPSPVDGMYWESRGGQLFVEDCNTLYTLADFRWYSLPVKPRRKADKITRTMNSTAPKVS